MITRVLEAGGCDGWCSSLTLGAILVTDDGRADDGRAVVGASLFVSPAPVARRMALGSAAYLATRRPGIFPRPVIPGVLDGRGISGLVQRVLSGLEMLMSMALAVRLLRIVGSARECREPARVEAAA